MNLYDEIWLRELYRWLLFVLQGFAQLLGQGLMMFQCTQSADHSAIGRILHGMAMVRMQ